MRPIAVYALGVLALGLIDDTLARGGADAGARLPHRGWRGHGAAVLRGELSTGALKAAGSLGLALLAMSYLGLSNGRWLLAAAVLVLATNAFNLLDLRPGRATKAFVLLGAGLAVGSADLRALWALGLFELLRSSPACMTCASGRCSGTPARTYWGRSPACGWCSACPGPAS